MNTIAPTAAPEQADLVEAFAHGAVAGAPGPIERIDTHLSHVFLTADKAFKLKRAVRLPFVDFSTCAQRRAACQAELEVNRRMGARLYLDACAVTRGQNGRFHIGGEGERVDWVVVMRRFDGAQQFDRLAQAGALSIALVERAARAIARMHARAPVTRLAGHAADYRHVIHELRETEAQGAARLGLAPGSARLCEALDGELVRIGALIERRRAAGKVRRGHGDLHLRNICVFEGEPMAFDALEFDERLATTDVLYDLAFMLMDLRAVGLNAHANAAMNAYWDEAGEDEAGLGLLGFFMALRAHVRMAVAIAGGDLCEAQSYRELGVTLLERRAPTLVALGGLSGVGKSAIGAALAARMDGPAGARLVRSDVLRKRALGLELAERAASEAYAPERRAETYRDLTTVAGEALAAGASVIADATFQSEEARTLIEEGARGAHFCAIWLEAPLSVRLARIAQRVGDASDADVAVARAQQEPAALGASWRRVDAGRPLGAVVEDIAALLMRIE